jgi:hypothetical protein
MEVTFEGLSLWIRNSNRNLQHAIADRQSNFQACSFNHSDISPFRINNLRSRTIRIPAIVMSPSMCRDHLRLFQYSRAITAPSEK